MFVVVPWYSYKFLNLFSTHTRHQDTEFQESVYLRIYHGNFAVRIVPCGIDNLWFLSATKDFHKCHRTLGGMLTLPYYYWQLKANEAG